MEAALPSKPLVKPRGEEVTLHDFDERRYATSNRREAYYGEDEDEEMGEAGYGPQVQCPQQ